MSNPTHTSDDAAKPVVVRSDPLSCRVRWHDKCVVETLSNGDVQHTAAVCRCSEPDTMPDIPAGKCGLCGLNLRRAS